MHVAIRPQWTENALRAAALRRIGGARRYQETLSDGVSNARKGSDYDFDLFIIRQFLDGLQPGCSTSAGQFKPAQPSRLA
jgi:hypothetical protein